MIDVEKWKRKRITKREYRDELLETLDSITHIEPLLTSLGEKIEVVKLSTQIVTELYVLDNESG